MQKGAIVSLFALSLFSCSNVGDFPLYRETLTNSEQVDIYVWLDYDGEWESGCLPSSDSIPNYQTLRDLQCNHPCPLKTMNKIIKRSGKERGNIDVYEIRYPMQNTFYENAELVELTCYKQYLLSSLFE